MPIGAVIPAAGKSSRMGAFKPLLPWGNTTILQRIIETLQTGGVTEIAVITGKNAPLIEDALQGSGVHLIHNPRYETSDMFYSTVLGIRFMAERVYALFCTPGDAPLFSAATVKTLIVELQTRETPILIPSFQGILGHPALFRSSVAVELSAYTGEGGMRGAIAWYPGVKTTLALDDPGIPFDVDTPEDYRRAKLMAESGSMSKTTDFNVKNNRIFH